MELGSGGHTVPGKHVRIASISLEPLEQDRRFETDKVHHRTMKTKNKCDKCHDVNSSSHSHIVYRTCQLGWSEANRTGEIGVEGCLVCWAYSYRADSVYFCFAALCRFRSCSGLLLLFGFGHFRGRAEIKGSPLFLLTLLRYSCRLFLYFHPVLLLVVVYSRFFLFVYSTFLTRGHKSPQANHY